MEKVIQINEYGRLTIEIKEVPQEVKNSTFGCVNCLWNGVECKQGSNYKEELEKGKKYCASYTYYD